MSTSRRRPISALALASRRANLEKARAAPKEKIYRSTEKRQAASRANLAKAIAARKSPRGNTAARLNALSHGLFVRDVASSVRRMGENPQEFREHHTLFERIFAPQDEQERDWVRCLADIDWKRLRFFRAQAAWELARLKKAFESLAHRTMPITADETLRRAYVLSRVLSGFLEYLDPLGKFQSRIDREIRKLLNKRSGGTIKYSVPRPTRGTGELFDSSIDSMVDDMLDDMLKSPRVRVRLR